MNDLVNFIQINATGLVGNIASTAYDVDFTGTEYQSSNPNAPVYKLFAKSPRGRLVEIGAVWRKNSKTTGRDYLTVTIDTGYGKLNANLGQLHDQDDPDLMAIIPWEK